MHRRLKTSDSNKAKAIDNSGTPMIKTKLRIKASAVHVTLYFNQSLNCGVINLPVIKIIWFIIFNAEFHLVSFGSFGHSAVPGLFLFDRLLPFIIWVLRFHLAKLILMVLPHKRG